MDTQNEMEKPKVESLIAQLAELNSRSRWYSSQLWQVPFAYLGIAGVVLARLADKNSIFGLGLIATGLFGIFVSIHMYGMQNGERRAVRNLQKIEKELKLEPTAECKHKTYVLPLQIAMTLVIIVCLIVGAYLLK
ncbi:hypothetical protein KKG48_03925 [Patescibacteria group bacterium]|nr:hypothetical protein [Patescibacteria group bacterium]